MPGSPRGLTLLTFSTGLDSVKVACPDLSDFIDFIATTGMRFDETVESYNLIVKLSKRTG